VCEQRRTGHRLRQNHRRSGGCDRRLVPFLAHIRSADVLLDADLQRLEAIALAGLLPDARERMRHCALRAQLLIVRQVVLDHDAREVLRDRLAAAVRGALALVRFNLRGALTVGLFSRLDGRQHLRLVEQHLLVGVLFGGVGLLRGTSVVLGLQPPYFLFQQHLAFDRLLMLALQPFIGLLDLLELYIVSMRTLVASGEVAPLLAYLRELQRRHHLSVLVVHHAKKGGARIRAGQALRGSSEFHAWGDSNLYLRRLGNELILAVEHRAAPSLPPIHLELTQCGESMALQLRTSSISTPDTPPPASLDERIVSILSHSDRPVPAAQLRALCSARKATF
jgi:hypothetical protein